MVYREDAQRFDSLQHRRPGGTGDSPASGGLSGKEGVMPSRPVWASRIFGVALIVAAVYFAGGSRFSTFRTQPLFDPIFASLFHTQDPDRLYVYFANLRYTVHFLEYFVMYLLAARLLGLRPRSALLLCIILAAADEGHQYFLPDRSCSSRDFSLDIAGAATALLTSAALSRRSRLEPAPARAKTEGSSSG